MVQPSRARPGPHERRQRPGDTKSRGVRVEARRREPYALDRLVAALLALALAELEAERNPAPGEHPPAEQSSTP